MNPVLCCVFVVVVVVPWAIRYQALLVDGDEQGDPRVSHPLLVALRECSSVVVVVVAVV